MRIEDASDLLAGRYMVVSMCLNKEEALKENEAIDMAIKALEKQIPKEPTKVTYFNDGSTEYGNCPVCDDGVSDYGNYCPHCGQALKW